MSRRRNCARRTFLRGAGGIALALPFLELFSTKKAHAAGAPKRYVFMFGGMSIGSNSTGRMAPSAEGAFTGALTPGLAPLGEYGVSDAVTLLSGLSIPAGASPPAGGRPLQFHSTSHQVLTTGQRLPANEDFRLPGPSSDWIAAKTIGQDTIQSNLVYRAQPTFYRNSSQGHTDGIISARHNASGQLEQVSPITSPRVAYESLFSGFVPDGGEASEEAKRALIARKSVVDLVSEDASSLVGRLGAADKIRMQRHFDELRALETRLEAIELPTGSSCSVLTHPGDDPPIGDAINPGGFDTYEENYMNADGYSNEDLRATIMGDLLHMALACDIARVSSFQLTHAQCFMNMYTLLGLPSDLHEISHSFGDTQQAIQDALGTCAAWHVKHFARLVQKLRDTEDVDGSTLLDNTAMTLAFEGGWGFDPQGNVNSSPHSTENMVMLVAGGAGGLKSAPGRHIKAPGVHPAAVLNTLLEAVGVEDTLGEVTAKYDALLG